VKTAADTFRANPAFKTDEAIMNLETGEALVSLLDAKGAPTMVERAKILFPLSQIGAVTEGQRMDIIKQSTIYGKYDKSTDRKSAFEVLLAAEEQAMQEAEAEIAAEEEAKAAAKAEKEAAKTGKTKAGIMSKVWRAVLTAVTSTVATLLGTYISNKVTGKQTKSKSSATGRVVKNAASAATRTITKELTRDILGNLK
jgi:hypothetical protein